MMEELVKLQNVYDHEKKEFKALEKSVAEFRDELLKVKKEKHLLSDNIKIKEEECETFKTTLYALNGKNVAMEKVVNDISESVELRDAELELHNRIIALIGYRHTSNRIYIKGAKKIIPK